MTTLWIFTVILTFVIMEFMAWFSHKYIMHGFLWAIHKDHHIKDHKSWFERNDLFFIFYALVSSGFVVLWGEMNFWFGLPIALGIFLLFKAISQHSKVSFISAGLKTFKFGIALNPVSCSIGWWVGPSSPRPIES